MATENKNALRDNRSRVLTAGDRVIAVHWGEIPLWLCSTKATVVGFGPKRVYLHFDGFDYSDGANPHACYPGSVRITEPADEHIPDPPGAFDRVEWR